MPSPLEILADLAEAFSRQQVTAHTLRVYLRELDDVPADSLERAVRFLIRTSEWFPTVRAIREAVAEQALGLPDESTALAQVAARMAWGRTDEDDRPPEPPELCPAVREALDLVGGFAAFRAAEEPGVIRGQFTRYYRERRADAIRRVQAGTLAPGRAEISR